MTRAARIERRLKDWLLACGWVSPGVCPHYGPHKWRLCLNAKRGVWVHCSSLGMAVDHQIEREASAV